MIRTDASRQIGSGHVMRCLTLADELRDKGAEVVFIMRGYDSNIDEYVRGKKFIVHLLPHPSEYNLQQNLDGYEQWLGVKQEKDAEETIQFIADKHIDWLIIDHYAIEKIWEKKLRPYVNKIMVIDDLANRKHDCDLLLDQNYIRDKSRYDQLISPSTIKLLGPNYVLLRKDFTKYRNIKKQLKKELDRVFVFFGGSDSYNLTTTALKSLEEKHLQHLFVDAVIGSANSCQQEIKEYIASNPRAKLHIQVDNIAEIMSSADIALGAGGSTTWERMAIGLPSIVVTTAENQVPFTKELYQDGYLNWLGNVDQVSQQKIGDAVLAATYNPQKLYEQSQLGQKLVPANGAEIISELLINGPNKETLSVRLAKISDCELYFDWATNDLVCDKYFNQEKIELEDYQEWFHNKVKDNNTILLVIESEFGVIGQVRFDRSGSHYRVNYSLGRQFSELGLAKHVLSIAIDYVKQENFFVIEGCLKDSHEASKKVFEQSSDHHSPIWHTCTNDCEKSGQLSIVVLSDRATWMNIWIAKLLAGFAIEGYKISWVNELEHVPAGDLCFILSYGKLVKAEIRNRNRNNLVVHASDLPKGKGWSPLSWQILEGKNEIVFTLFKAEDAVDSGEIYLQEKIQLSGNELVNELRQQQAEITLKLCHDFTSQYPEILNKPQQQQGESTFYAKRMPVDSVLDPNKTIAEQFNMLRIVDNDRYPAYFEWEGHSYILKIDKL